MGNREYCGGVGAKRGNDLGGRDDNSIGNLAVGVILLNIPGFVRGIDGDFDGDGTTTDLFTLEGVDGLLLFGLVTNVDKTIPLAPPGLTPPGSDDASGVDIETCISEECGEAGVVDVEAEVGNEENGLGWFADRVLTGGTRGTRSPGFALLVFGSILRGRISCRGICGGSGGLSFARLGLVTALKIGSGMMVTW